MSAPDSGMPVRPLGAAGAPAFCSTFRADPEMCGGSREEALDIWRIWKKKPAPSGGRVCAARKRRCRAPRAEPRFQAFSVPKA